MGLPGKVSFALAAACWLAVVPRAAAAAGNASIATDGSLGPARMLAGPHYQIPASLGTQKGPNLFQSFKIFGLLSDETATFSGPASVNNVIGRVTGGKQSSIDGAIQSTIKGANLFLINPSGIIFGSHATINVSGSFHASTADYLKMADGKRFQATNPSGSTLSAAPPSAFGFLTATPARITVNGSTLGPVPGTLGLVGGPPVTIENGASLSAPAGTIHVASVAGAGEVPVDPRNTAALTVTSFGPVNIGGGSMLDVSNRNGIGAGGSVFIRSGALTIDASEINADNYGSGAGGQIALQDDSNVTLSNGANVHSLAMGSGGAAAVSIATAPAGVILADASTVQTQTGAAGGGSITITAGQLTLRNGTNVLAESSGTTTGGAVAISVGGSLTIDTGASLYTMASAVGNAGDLSVKVGGPATIENGSFYGSLTAGTKSAGNVTLTAGALTLSNNALLVSTNFGFGNPNGAGNSGDIAIKVSGMLSITDASLVFADTYSGGNAGKVTVKAGAISVVDHSSISSDTYGSASGGKVFIKADGQLTVDNSSITADSAAGSTGDAGEVIVKAQGLAIAHGGEIFSSALEASNDSPASTGDAGSVTVKVGDLLSIDGAAAGARTAIGADSEQKNAGQVTVNAGTLSIANSGSISTDAFGPEGNPGQVTVTAGILSIGNSGAIDSSGAGNGGGISVTAGSLTIAGSGEISSASSGSGNSGDVSVDVTGSQPGALTILTNGVIRASTFGRGNAGSVAVSVAGGLTIEGDGLISSQANRGSAGNAGNVSITADTVSITNGGAISSDTFAQGLGGNVSVTTGSLSIASSG
jgi:filamentous hemagglutinin family protein